MQLIFTKDFCKVEKREQCDKTRSSMELDHPFVVNLHGLTDFL